MDTIKIRGARTHNLKNISLDLPRNKLIVITGLSGSGKSSLAFGSNLIYLFNIGTVIFVIEHSI